MKTRRYSAALLTAVFALAGCQGGTSTHMTPSTLFSPDKTRRKPHLVVSNQCIPTPGQTVGTITEYTVPTSGVQPFGIAADQNGNLWFAEWNASALGKFNIASHAFTAYSTPTKPATTIRVAIGPDGNPWIGEVAPNAGKIAKFNLGTSTFTEYQAYGGANSEPEWLTVAPAGTPNAGLWVSLYQEARLDNITTSGAQTLHASQSGPYGISSDTLGNIWYTTLDGNKIGVQRMDGTTGSWTVPTSSSEPEGITEGPPGTGMWFTEAAANKIGNITSAGSITEYTIPTTGSHPYEVVSACGNLWFTEYDGNKIGELNPETGAFSEYAVPTASSEPTGLTVDVNGNVWFTERSGNKIGKITTVGAASPAPDGSIYVLNSTGGAIVNYGAGNYLPPPAATITSLPGAGWDTNGHIAFDSSGNLWVTDGADVAEYAANANGAAIPLATFQPADTNVQNIAIDAAGEILLSDSATNTIYAYAANSSGAATPIRTISGSATQLDGISRMIVDGSGNLWVVNVSSTSIAEFPVTANGNVAPSLYLDSTWANNNGMPAISSIAFDHSGDLLVLANNGEHVFTFAPGVNESSHYIRQIATQELSDIAVDDEGYIYGTSEGPEYGVLIYPPGASGSPNPYAVIAAANDGFSDPGAIAVWSNPSWWYGGDGKRRKPAHH